MRVKAVVDVDLGIANEITTINKRLAAIASRTRPSKRPAVIASEAKQSIGPQSQKAE